MTYEQKAKCKQILEHYGAENQRRQLCEECAELIQAAIKYERTGRNLEAYSHLLYECGFKRIGCIGCPMASRYRYFEFRRYPKYKENYIRAFDRMIKHRNELGLVTKWKNSEQVFKWWMEEDPDQISFEGIFDVKE